jgi:hypothetical protein
MPRGDEGDAVHDVEILRAIPYNAGTGRMTLLHGAKSPMVARSGSRVNRFIALKSLVTSRACLPWGGFACLTPRRCLILFLAVTFFLLCPLWAYLSLCSMDAHHGAGQSCFLYSFVFNMPVSLVAPALLLVILASLGVITDYRAPPVFRSLFSRFLARAPPLSYIPRSHRQITA